jgi:uncharacterized oligopeptide transporter (OPT) family protein
LPLISISKEDAMTTHTAAHHWMSGLARVVEHSVAVAFGFVLMIVGLGLGVTMIMLPVGLVVGLLGVALVIGGLFAHIDQS